MKKNLTEIIHVPRQLLTIFKLTFCFIALTISQFSAGAQSNAKDIKISGKINSAQGEPLAGVSIRVKNTSNSTMTDGSGNFTLTAAENAVVEVSYVGFKKQEVAISGRTELTISLEVESNLMNDVVVVGY